MKTTHTYKVIAGLFVATTLSSCFKDTNSPGYEYMPDMYRSPAIEAYVDYGEVRTWKSNDSIKNTQSAFHPPVGTIPFQGTDSNEIFLPYKRLPAKAMLASHGIVSMEYSETDYEESVNDVNPLEYNYTNAKKGEVLYNRFCDHCHGAKGKGDGPIVTSSGGVITPPADAFSLPDGKMFYSITYGKNAMGSHSSQLNQKERWELITYLNVLNNDGEFPEKSLGTQLDELMADADKAHGEHLALSNLEFETGSAVLKHSPQTQKTLETLLQFMQNYEVEIGVEGHTDNTGNAEANLALSQERANSVKNFLTEKGIDGSRITATGYGDTKPLEPNDTEEGKARNRRTEIVIK